MIPTRIDIFDLDKTGFVIVSHLADEVLIMSSKVRPKRVTAIGSDGLDYRFLCKEERRGDLKRDKRVMEFGHLINESLKGSAEARMRGLSITAYQVNALSETAGLIEWVDNTCGMRLLVEAQATFENNFGLFSA
jgi:serine/threonine-protein kinase ATR